MIYHATRIVGLALLDFGRAAGRVFVKVWDFTSAFYNRVLKPFVSWTWNQVQRLHNWLVKTVGPLVKTLRQVREWILRTYDKWLKPIFATIDAVRGMMRILEIFHVPFAEAIDRKLADLESRLLAPIRFALVKVNEVIGWIDRIVTFDGLFQRLTFLASQIEYARETLRVLYDADSPLITADDRRRIRSGGGAQPPEATLVELRSLIRDDEGPLAKHVEGGAAIGRRLLRAL